MTPNEYHNRRDKAKADPFTFIKEQGFEDELRLVQAGKCPMCESYIVQAEFTEAGMAEFQKSFICQKCFEKLT